MEKLEVRTQIMDMLSNLTRLQQTKLLDFIRSLIQTEKKTKSGILKLAGSIDKEDLKLMEKTIEEDCEKINMDEW